MAERLSRSTIEAASWRLASDLVRRHPRVTRVLHTHPGGGQYDCLTIASPGATSGVIQLNRAGRIQVQQRFDGGQESQWTSVGWREYVQADSREFVVRLETAAGLPSPRRTPPATATTLTYRVLAAVASVAIESGSPIEIHSGYFDSSDGSRPNRASGRSPAIPTALLDRRDTDLFAEPGYRFWIVERGGVPILAFEQEQGVVWTERPSAGVDLLGVYRRCGHDATGTAIALLRMVDGPLNSEEGPPMTEATMTKAALLEWANEHADGPVVATPDYQLSLTSRLIRFTWMDGSAVGVGHDADGKTRINSVLDTVSAATGGVVHLLLGVGALGPADPALREHLGAIGTLLANLRGGPEVRVWTLAPGEEPKLVDLTPAAFTSDTPRRWAKMLTAAAAAPVAGMAAEVAAALADRPSFALYPKLSSLASQTPWQMRLDGLEIGRTGPTGTTLHLASTDVSRPGQPREAWLSEVGHEPLYFAPNEVADLVAIVDRLIARWTDAKTPAAVLCHGQAEHALEAHLLSGRLVLDTSMAGSLRPAVPFRSGTLAAAQFPTLWGDVTRPARYLDALLADEMGRPWAVELKDQAAGGGHGAYLRHGIGQAVLYRHYIRSAPALNGWFETHGMQRKECQAALAFPKATASTEPVIKKLRALAAQFGVEVIEFPRPA